MHRVCLRSLKFKDTEYFCHFKKAIEKSFTRSAVEFFYKKETLKSRTTAAFWYVFVLAGILTSGKMIHANCQRYSNYTTVMESREVPTVKGTGANFAVVTVCTQILL